MVVTATAAACGPGPAALSSGDSSVALVPDWLAASWPTVAVMPVLFWHLSPSRGFADSRKVMSAHYCPSVSQPGPHNDTLSPDPKRERTLYRAAPDSPEVTTWRVALSPSLTSTGTGSSGMQ